MKERILEEVEKIKDLKALAINDVENIRIEYLGKKGLLNSLFSEFKTVPSEQKKEIGLLLNDLKIAIQDKIEALKESLAQVEEYGVEKDDLTKPATEFTLGSRHPLSLVRNEIIDIFSRIGYIVEEGPEIEDDWHVFSSLNFPPEHPADRKSVV